MIKVGDVQVTTLSPDDEAAVTLRMRLEGRQGDVATARSVASAARAAAQRFPKNDEVLEVLAQAELQAKHYPEASAAADQAIALDPKAVKALIYKGRAELELAKKNKQAANWPAIRGWFSKANHLDPQAPEPLMYYYETYDEQGGAIPIPGGRRPAVRGRTRPEGLRSAPAGCPSAGEGKRQPRRQRDVRADRLLPALREGEAPQPRHHGQDQEGRHSGRACRCSRKTKRKPRRTADRQISSGSAPSALSNLRLRSRPPA